MRELMPEEEEQLDRIEETVNNIGSALFGKKHLHQLGLLDRFEEFRARVELQLTEFSLRIAAVESRSGRWVFGATCVGIGILISTAIFVGLKLKDIVSIVK